jgi:hypothetical protein
MANILRIERENAAASIVGDAMQQHADEAEEANRLYFVSLGLSTAQVHIQHMLSSSQNRGQSFLRGMFCTSCCSGLTKGPSWHQSTRRLSLLDSSDGVRY